MLVTFRFKYLIIIGTWNKLELDLSMFIDSDLFLLLLGSWVLGLFYSHSHVKLMIYSACCKSFFIDSCWYYYQDLSFMPETMFLCQFSLCTYCYTNSTFPYLFSFDEPWSISDLGLNRDLLTIEYGEMFGILPIWIYVFGITWNWKLGYCQHNWNCKFGHWHN